MPSTQHQSPAIPSHMTSLSHTAGRGSVSSYGKALGLPVMHADMACVLVRLLWGLPADPALYAAVTRAVMRLVHLQALIVMRTNGVPWPVETAPQSALISLVTRHVPVATYVA